MQSKALKRLEQLEKAAAAETDGKIEIQVVFVHPDGSVTTLELPGRAERGEEPVWQTREARAGLAARIAE